MQKCRNKFIATNVSDTFNTHICKVSLHINLEIQCDNSMYINIYARIYIYIHIYISYETFNENDTYLWVGELNAKWLV